MEDPKLVAYFQDVVEKVKSKGFSDGTIRESFHEAAPKAAWHERAYLALVDGSATTYGLTTVMAVIFGGGFVPDLGMRYILAAFLFLPTAFLYFFAIGAFKYHAGEKLAMTALVSIIVSVGAYVFDYAYHRIMDPLLAQLQQAQAVAHAAASIPGVPAIAGSAAAKGAAILAIFGASPTNVWVLIAIIVTAFNLPSLLFLLVELWKKTQKKGKDPTIA